MSTTDVTPQGKIDKNNPFDCFDMWIMFDHASFAIARAREIELAKFGLTIEQGAVLHDLIDRGGSATLSEIAESTLRQYHSVSTLVNRMTRAGLLKKVKYSDNKKFQISVTEKGYEMYGKVTRNSINMIFSSLPPADQKIFYKHLKQLVTKTRSLLGLDYKHPFLP
jgi:DNA-binding MarR family transcriptional regulator